MRQRLELRAGIEPALSPWHSDVIPLDQRGIREVEWRPRNDSRRRIRNSKSAILSGAGERIRTFIKPGLSRSPLPIGLRQHALSLITFQASFSTGGGSRTLINWFLRPVPLPGWATPAKVEHREVKIDDDKFDLRSSSSILALKRRRQESNLHRIHPAA